MVIRGRSPQRRVSPRNFLAGLSPEHFEALRRLMRPVEFDDGDVLCRQGEPADRAWFVDEGAIALSVALPGGGETEVAVARAGEILGELGLMTDSRRTATARADGPVRLLEVERTDFRGLLSYFHPASLGVTHRLGLLAAERIHEATRLVLALDQMPRPPVGEAPAPAPGSDDERGCAFDHRAFLPALPFFAGYGQRDLDELLARAGPLWTLPRGRVLAPTGYRPRALYVVLRGAVELRLGGAEGIRRLGVVGPGGVVGAVPLLTGRRRLAEARVREPAALLEIGEEALDGLLDESHRVAFKLLAGLVPKLAERLESTNQVVSRLRRERRAAGLSETLADPGTAVMADLVRASVLVVDEDPATRERSTAVLRAAQHRVEEAPHADAGAARARDARGAFDVIVLAADVAEAVLERASPTAPVVVVGGDDSLEAAVRAMRAGAHEYLPRGSRPSYLAYAIQRLLDKDAVRA